MDRSVAQGRPTDPPTDLGTDAARDPGIARWQAILVGCLLAGGVVTVILLSYAREVLWMLPGSFAIAAAVEEVIPPPVHLPSSHPERMAARIVPKGDAPE